MTSHVLVTLLPFTIALVAGALLPVQTRTLRLLLGVCVIYLVAAYFGYDGFYAWIERTALAELPMTTFVVLSFAMVAIGWLVNYQVMKQARLVANFLGGWFGATATILVVGSFLAWYFTGDPFSWLTSHPIIPAGVMWFLVLLAGALLASVLV